MRDTFVEILTKRIDEKYKSRRAFIRAAEPKANENGAQAYLAHVIGGRKPPPMDRIEAWADALDLSGRERDRFIDLACITHLPDSAQSHFIKILDRLEKAEEIITAMAKGKR